MSELEEYLAEPEPEFDYATFRVDSLSRASWAIKKLSVAQRRINEVKLEAMAEIDKVNDWAVHATKSARDDETFFTNALKGFMLRERESEGTKSIVLPDGEVTSRAIPAKAEVSDKELFFKYCHENGRELWIRTKEEPDLASLKDGVSFSGDAVVDDLTGESIPGLVGIEADISVSVKVSTT